VTDSAAEGFALALPPGVLRLPGDATVGAELAIAIRPEAIRLEVADQGRGLAAPTASPGEGHELGVGVAGMKERVRQLGGLLEFDSSGTGLTVRAILPRRP